MNEETGTENGREITCDQVAWLLNAFERYLPEYHHPAISRYREMQVYGLLYEAMEAANLKFSDDAARNNATPGDVRVNVQAGGVGNAQINGACGFPPDFCAKGLAKEGN